MAGSLRRDAFGNEERFRKLKMRGWTCRNIIQRARPQVFTAAKIWTLALRCTISSTSFLAKGWSFKVLWMALVNAVMNFRVP
jgi:hypothetical protein